MRRVRLHNRESADPATTGSACRHAMAVRVCDNEGSMDSRLSTEQYTKWFNFFKFGPSQHHCVESKQLEVTPPQDVRAVHRALFHAEDGEDAPVQIFTDDDDKAARRNLCVHAVECALQRRWEAATGMTVDEENDACHGEFVVMDITEDVNE